MHGELFDSTIPFGEPELMRASAYRRYLDEMDAKLDQASLASARISELSPSLRADLYRFEMEDGGTGVVDVMAACVRHAKRVTMHLQCGAHVVPLTVFPQEHLVHCPIDIGELIGKQLPQLEVMHIEPAVLQPPGESADASLVGDLAAHYPLAPLLWELAIRGARRELLPEIVGPAVYRVAPALDIAALPASGVLRATIMRLRRQSANLTEIAGWPGLNRERASRLLNALYLQAGLIVSRAHPDAVRESWFGGL